MVNLIDLSCVSEEERIGREVKDGFFNVLECFIYLSKVLKGFGGFV